MLLSVQRITLREATLRPCLVSNVRDPSPLIISRIPFISGQDQFVLKDIPKDIFSNSNEKIRPQLHESPYICLPCDVIPNRLILLYST